MSQITHAILKKKTCSQYTILRYNMSDCIADIYHKNFNKSSNSMLSFLSKMGQVT